MAWKAQKKSRLLSRHSSCSRADKIFVFNKVFVIYFLKRFSPPPVDTHTTYCGKHAQRASSLPGIVAWYCQFIAACFSIVCQLPVVGKESRSLSTTKLWKELLRKPVGFISRQMRPTHRKYVELHDNMWSLVEPGKKLWVGGDKKLVPNLGNVAPASATMSEGWE